MLDSPVHSYSKHGMSHMTEPWVSVLSFLTAIVNSKLELHRRETRMSTKKAHRLKRIYLATNSPGNIYIVHSNYWLVPPSSFCRYLWILVSSLPSVLERGFTKINTVNSATPSMYLLWLIINFQISIYARKKIKRPSFLFKIMPPFLQIPEIINS